MPLIVADRVKEGSTTTGTGAFALAGAAVGFRAFSAVCAVGDTCYYTIQSVDNKGVPTAAWEVGLGTYSAANTLTRTTVLASSNAGAAVNFAAGTKQVWIDLAAQQLLDVATLKSGVGFIDVGPGLSTTSISTSAFAMKGNLFDCPTAVKVSAAMASVQAGGAGEIYKAIIYSVTAGTATVAAKMAESATWTSTNASAQNVSFAFPGPVPMVAGSRYAIVIVLTNAGATGVCRVNAPTSATATSWSALTYVDIVRVASLDVASGGALTNSGTAGAMVSMGLVVQYADVGVVKDGVYTGYKGARVRKSADQALTPTAYTTMSWGAVDRDTSGFFNAASPTRLTIPVGVTRVRIAANIETNTNNDNIGLLLWKNGASVAGGVANFSSGGNYAIRNGVSDVLDVVAGDYFELRVWDSGAAGYFAKMSPFTWFSVEVVEAVAITNPAMPKMTILSRAANQSIPSGTWTKVSYDTIVQDDVGAFSAGTPTQVIVPSGYTKVRITSAPNWANLTSGYRYQAIHKNTVATKVQAGLGINESANCLITRWLTVTPGDVLDIQVHHTTGAALNLSGAAYGGPTDVQFEWMP